MGFGTGRFGESRFGSDPLPPPGHFASVQPPIALLYDIRTRTFPLSGTTGLFRAIHPIDQKVALAMGLVQGRLASDPSAGINFKTLTRLSAAQIQSAAEKLVRQNTIIAALVANGDITILKIETATPVRGNNQVALTYMNNRTQQVQKA